MSWRSVICRCSRTSKRQHVTPGPLRIRLHHQGPNLTTASPILRLAALAARRLPPSLVRLLYRLGPLTRALRDLLNRSAPSGPTVTTVAGGGLAGLSMLLDLQTEKDYWLGTYEPELQSAIVEAVRPWMIVYDLGANIGYLTLLLARGVGTHGRVVAFEPLPANLERLGENIRLNGLDDRVEVIPAAVGVRSGSARFLLHTSGEMGKLEGSAGREAEYAGQIEVSTIRLDDFIFKRRRPPPDLIKMDLEGGEVLAIPGMQQVLQRVRPLLMMELHGPQAAQAAWLALSAAGYSLCQIREGYPPINSLQDLGWKAYVLGLPQARRL